MQRSRAHSKWNITSFKRFRSLGQGIVQTDINLLKFRKNVLPLPHMSINSSTTLKMKAVCSSITLCPCTSTFSSIPSEGGNFYQRFVLHELCDEDNTFCSNYPISVVMWLVSLRSAAEANHLQLSSKYKVPQMCQHTYCQTLSYDFTALIQDFFISWVTSLSITVNVLVSGGVYRKATC
jgi:hypothetical protein